MEIFDFTMDAHPIRIHQVQFCVDRDYYMFEVSLGQYTTWRHGERLQDTVIVYGQLTRAGQIDLPVVRLALPSPSTKTTR